ncbi:aMP-forming long-chain acyl-CoA synthetase [Candidatus Colimorpha enterica]|uniref:AMP-forming long-chain acyl-CoA synthetase n=1 Tax=Candidatus Colimorpha enterica TaxID=3083063 RepID=R6U3Z7_9BACT|nr:aMP-forming long-chain acyl-CoA synthetase [Candidatus Colimorpha enterica]
MKKNVERQIPKTVTDLLQLVRTGAECFGEKDIYVYQENKQEKHLSYRENYERVLWFGTALCHYDLDGKKIAVVGDTHPSYMTAFFATIASNSTIVPLDKDLNDDALIDFMNIAEVSAVIYTASFNRRLINYADRLPAVKYFIPIIDEGEDCAKDNVIAFNELLEIGRMLYEGGNTAFTDIEPDLDHLAAILFTSGTTGTSKGVMLTHRNFVAATNGSDQSMTQFNRKNVFVDCLPMNHSYEITCGQLAIQNLGATMVINDSIKNVLRNFVKYKPNALMLVPLYVETMYKKIWSEIDKKGMKKKVRTAMKISDALLKVGIDMREKFFSQITGALGGNLKIIVVGGAPMRPEIISDFRSFGIYILEGYGITECSPLVAVNRLGSERPHSVGPAVECCQVRIDKQPGEETGEIVVKGENVMVGYYNNPEATAAVFTDDGWFKTGDIGYMDKDGYIYITGRKKNVIILSNGKNVFPEEIEEHLSDRSDVIGESVVLGRPNASGETVITAVIYPNPDFSKDKTREEVEAAVRAAVTEVNKSLPVYKQVRDTELRDTEFEKTTTRKIKRFLVR